MPEPYTSDSSDSRDGSVSLCRPLPTSFETGAEGSHRTTRAASFVSKNLRSAQLTDQSVKSEGCL